MNFFFFFSLSTDEIASREIFLSALRWNGSGSLTLDMLGKKEPEERVGQAASGGINCVWDVAPRWGLAHRSHNLYMSIPQ